MDQPRARVLFMAPVLWCALGVALSVPAQGPLADRAEEDPVAVLTRMALDGNPGLRARRKQVEAAGFRPTQARALPDPSADLEFMMISVSDPSLRDALTEGVSLGVTQSLPGPGKLRAREEKALSEVALARADLAAAESDLAADIAAAAYRHALARRKLEINAERASLLRSASEGALARYASGGGTQADVLASQTALTENDLERQTIEQEQAIAGDRLASLLGGDPPQELVDRLSLPAVGPAPELDPLLRELREGAPRMRAARAREAAEDAGASVARSDLRPDFSVGLRYRHRDPTMGGGDYLTASVGMTLPFFNRKRRYQPALQEALTRAEASRFESEETFNRLRFELLESLRAAERDRRSCGLLDGALLPQARQTFEAALAAYGSGQNDFNALLSALTALYDFEGQAAEALAGYHVSLARIGALLGRPPGTAPTEGSRP